MKIKYPIYIEVPDGYWTMTTTINLEFEEDPNKHWHNSEDD